LIDVSHDHMMEQTCIYNLYILFCPNSNVRPWWKAGSNTCAQLTIPTKILITLEKDLSAYVVPNFDSVVIN
jgi:hypothetical protein